MSYLKSILSIFFNEKVAAFVAGALAISYNATHVVLTHFVVSFNMLAGGFHAHLRSLLAYLEWGMHDLIAVVAVSYFALTLLYFLYRFWSTWHSTLTAPFRKLYAAYLWLVTYEVDPDTIKYAIVVPTDVDYSDFSQPSVMLQKEAAFSDNTGLYQAHNGQASVMALLADIDGMEGRQHVGFAVSTTAGIKTAYHCVHPKGLVIRKMFLAKATDHSKMVECYPSEINAFADQATLVCPHAGPVLGVKQAPIKFVNSSKPVSVMHFDSRKKEVIWQNVRLNFELEKIPAYASRLVIATRTNTARGDSGAPVFQGRYVVALHTGAHMGAKVNVHSLLYRENEKEVKELSDKDLDLKTLLESAVIGVDRFAQAKAELARQRMLGEHRVKQAIFRGDDQTPFGADSVVFDGSMPIPKGMSWADYDDMLQDEIDAPTPSESSSGNCSAPKQGRVQVPAPSQLVTGASQSASQEKLASNPSLPSSLTEKEAQLLKSLKKEGISLTRLKKIWKEDIQASLENSTLCTTLLEEPSSSATVCSSTSQERPQPASTVKEN